MGAVEDIAQQLLAARGAPSTGPAMGDMAAVPRPMPPALADLVRGAREQLAGQARQFPTSYGDPEGDARAMSPETFVPQGMVDWTRQAAGKDVATLRGVGQAMGDLATLPRRAIGASETMRQGGEYDPGPILEAAALPMGAGLGGVPARAGETVLGAGPMFPTKAAARIELNQSRRVIDNFMTKQRAWQEGGPRPTSADRDAALDAFKRKDAAQQHLMTEQPIDLGESDSPVRAGEAVLGAGAIRGVNSAMPKTEVSSLQDLKDALASSGSDPLFVRYSNGPKFDMKPGAVSMDHQTGEVHNGLSAVELNGGMDDAKLVRYLRDYASGGDPHIYSGKVTGLDSDRGPTIQPTKYIGKLSKTLTDLIGDESVPHRLELQKMVAQYNSVLDRLTPSQHQRLQEMKTTLDAMGGSVNHPGLGDNFSLNLNYD